MAMTEKDLAEIGAHCSTQRMLEQLPVSIALAREHQTELGVKFLATKVDELSTYHEEIKTQFQEQSDGKFDARTGNVDVNEVMKNLKELIRDILAAADNAYDEEPTVRDQFHVGPLGKSVAGIIKKSEIILALAKKNADDLKEWGLTAEEITLTETALNDLSNAGTKQEIDVKNLPPKTRKLYVVKGRAHMLLKKLKRAAKRRFVSDPTLAAKFNLDILNRKGKDRGPGDKPTSVTNP
jgi:hypothetical protein